MSPGNRILHTELVRRLACWLAAGYIRLVHATSRWRVLGGDTPAALWDQDRPFILVFWHGRLLMMPYCWRPGKTMNLLISRHRDGELLARTIGRFGFGMVRGSPKQGGAAALRALVKGLKAGEHVAVTPDGPRGPRMRASPGIVSTARLAGVPVVPCAVATSRRRLLPSWDRMQMPLPFSRGVFVWGQAIEVARDADAATSEAARLEIERELNRITAEADRLCGLPAVAPDPAAAPDLAATP